VNSYFRAPDLKEDSTPRTYEKILFEDVPYAPEQLTYALKHRQEYRQDFQKADRSQSVINYPRKQKGRSR